MAEPMMTSIRVTQSKDVIAQQVDEKTVLFDMATGNYYSLNELGGRVWVLIGGDASLADIAEQLASEYEAPAETILTDLRAMIDDFQGAGLLVESDG